MIDISWAIIGLSVFGTVMMGGIFRTKTAILFSPWLVMLADLLILEKETHNKAHQHGQFTALLERAIRYRSFCHTQTKL